MTTNSPSPPHRLPVTRSLTLAYAVSLLIALLMAVVSLAGLLYRSDIYPSDELARSFVANDVVNLVIGLPILLGSMWLSRRGKLIGLLFWPGALFYVAYTYIIYVFAMPLNWAFLIYLSLLTLGTYTMSGVVAGIDAKAVEQRLGGAVPERAAGGVLAVLGALFFVRAIGVLGEAILSQTPLPGVEVALLVADFLLSPAWVIGGLLLWRRQALGYVGGAGLLYQASMLFIGLIVVLLLAPLISGAPFVPADIIAVFVMGLVCFMPFALFVRGVMSRQ